MNHLDIELIKQAIQDAENLKSKLPDSISKKYGFSSQKIRHLLNNLCSFNNVKYLNIGLFKGSSFWSAIFNNQMLATGIDTFSPPGANKEVEKDFYKNLAEVISNEEKTVLRQINIICQDCFSIELKDKYNIFFYDGDHAEECQYKALTYFDQYMEDEFILIVDDFDGFCDNNVKLATDNAIKKMHYNTLFRWEGKGDFGNWDVNTNNVWWNGLLVCLLSKNE
jgi:hypothetical protein